MKVIVIMHGENLKLVNWHFGGTYRSHL